MATLQNFGVPMGGGAGRGGIIHPKPKNHFRVRVFGFGPVAGGLELSQQVMTCDRPKKSQPEVTVHSYNSTAYYAGKIEWQAVSLVVRDDRTNSVARLVGHQEQKQMNHFQQTTAFAGSNYKFTTYIEGLDGGNDDVVEQWVLEGCFLTNTDYDGYDYASADPMTINMTIRYDNATQTGGLMPLLPELGTGVLLTG